MTRSGFLQSAARRLGRSEQGVTMIEFGLVFPVMLLVFIGMVEFGEAFSIDRKISNAASTVADLVSQESAVTTGDLQDIANVAAELVKPYRADPLSLRIYSVVASDEPDDAKRTAKVAWTFPDNIQPGVGAIYRLPNGRITEANSSLIVTETSYAFAPSVGYFIGNITLNGIAFFRPRLTRAVDRTN